MSCPGENFSLQQDPIFNELYSSMCEITQVRCTGVFGGYTFVDMTAGTSNCTFGEVYCRNGSSYSFTPLDKVPKNFSASCYLNSLTCSGPRGPRVETFIPASPQSFCTYDSLTCDGIEVDGDTFQYDPTLVNCTLQRSSCNGRVCQYWSLTCESSHQCQYQKLPCQDHCLVFVSFLTPKKVS